MYFMDSLDTQKRPARPQVSTFLIIYSLAGPSLVEKNNERNDSAHIPPLARLRELISALGAKFFFSFFWITAIV